MFPYSVSPYYFMLAVGCHQLGHEGSLCWIQPFVGNRQGGTRTPGVECQRVKLVLSPLSYMPILSS